MTTQNNLRRLRKFLLLTQKEMADFGGCSRFTIQAAELGRKKLSPRVASELSRRIGIDLIWLTNDDPAAPLIDHAGRPYSRETYERHNERHKTNRHAPDASHYRWRELQLGVAFDLLHRILAASRVKGTTTEFMDGLDKFIKSQLSNYIPLEDAVYGERRRATKAALKTGKVVALQLLTPSGPEPFRRGRERLEAALAAFTARQVKSDKRV